MIIPIIFTLAPYCDNLFYTWIFYKGIDIAKHDGWPVFAQRQYFEQREKQRNMMMISPVTAEVNDFEMSMDSDFARILCREFPQEKIDAYLKRFPSQTDAYLASMRDPWEEMTNYLAEEVHKCEEIRNEKAEAFLCLGAPRFVTDAGKKLGIDVIHYEWGPLRIPNYRKTAYFDLKGSVCDGEMVSRYDAFQKIKDEVPIFTKKEILAFFLNDEQLDKLKRNEPPRYRAGMTLGYSVPNAYSFANQITAAEALTKLHEYFSDEEIIARYHPGDPMHSELYGPRRVDGNLIDFIQDSERIICISSNIAYEAMLWDRPAYDLGETQYGRYANHELKGLPDRIASDDFLSFIAFGYIIPFEMLKNVEYIRWRLSRPSEKEIYLYHLKYYCDCLGILEEDLINSEDGILPEILRKRHIEGGLSEFTDRECNRNSRDELTRAYAAIERLLHEKKRWIQMASDKESAIQMYEQQKIQLEQKIQDDKAQIDQLNEQLQTLHSEKNARELEVQRLYQRVLFEFEKNEQQRKENEKQLSEFNAQFLQEVRSFRKEISSEFETDRQQSENSQKKIEAHEEYNRQMIERISDSQQSTHEEIKRIKQINEQNERRINALTEEKITMLMTELEQTKNDSNMLRIQNSEFRQKLEVVEQENETLKRTYSWRITAPLRKCKRMLKFWK